MPDRLHEIDANRRVHREVVKPTRESAMEKSSRIAMRNAFIRAHLSM